MCRPAPAKSLHAIVQYQNGELSVRMVEKRTDLMPTTDCPNRTQLANALTYLHSIIPLTWDGEKKKTKNITKELGHSHSHTNTYVTRIHCTEQTNSHQPKVMCGGSVFRPMNEKKTKTRTHTNTLWLGAEQERRITKKNNGTGNFDTIIGRMNWIG